jgi:hypothetical protein
VSQFENKSQIYLSVAENAESKYMFPAVAHCAYYSCVHLMQHIWYYKMKKTESELMGTKTGVHNVLINNIGQYIRSNQKNRNARQDFHDFNNIITQLKKLRIDADYKDTVFDLRKSQNSITLAKELLPILKRA